MYPHHKNAILRRNSSRLLLMRSGSAEVQPFMDFSSSSSFSSPDNVDAFNLPLVGRAWGSSHAAAATPTFKLFFVNPFQSVASIFRSIFCPAIQSLLIPTCQFLVSGSTSSASRAANRRGRRLTGTFFGQKKGRVSFAVQETPSSEPILLLELATPTSHLVREMATGMVRILLECESESGSGTPKKRRGALLDEKVWTMYCNGHKLGYATSRPACTASDLHVLGAVQAISVGAGVMPAAAAAAAAPTDSTLALPAPVPPPHPTEVVVGKNNNSNSNNEVMYMRAKFERVIGSRDSEAFYMINPDCGGGREGSGGPELSIFLLRI